MECTIPDEPKVTKEVESWEQTHEGQPGYGLGAWELYVDGSSSSMGSGAGLILSWPDGTITEYTLHFEFSATNNEVEYEALAAGLRITRELGIRGLKAHNDSQLVVSHI